MKAKRTRRYQQWQNEKKFNEEEMSALSVNIKKGYTKRVMPIQKKDKKGNVRSVYLQKDKSSSL